MGRAAHHVGLPRLASLHGGEQAVSQVLDVSPAEGGASWDHRQPAPQVGGERPCEVAAITGAVHRPGHDDDQGQPAPDHRQCHLVVSLPLGALVGRGQPPVVAIGLVHHPAPGVPVDGQGAGVHAPGDPQFAHHLEHIAGAGHVHRLRPLPVPGGHTHVGGQVENPLHPLHGPADRSLVEHVADVAAHPVGSQPPGLLRRAHERGDQVPLRQEPRGQVAADEAGRAGDQIVHRRRMLFGGRGEALRRLGASRRRAAATGRGRHSAAGPPPAHGGGPHGPASAGSISLAVGRSASRFLYR